ncbi:MAG: SH3 domain-containing protein [Dysgonamonadaceae bacterium]|jgi:hypothetical protein|nr:SH3 domain-containing protein [Dysgonamonadaceae bacterium]
MKKILLILICLTGCFVLNAQESYYYGFEYTLQADEKYYVYADVANVRIEPDSKADIENQLSAGQEVTIIETDDKGDNPVVIDGFTGKWLYVSYTINDVKRAGWIWSNTLSYKQLRRGDTKFVFGIDKIVKFGFQWSVKAIDNGKIVDRKFFTVSGEESHSPYAKIMDGVQLENVKCVVRIASGGEACGIGAPVHYFAWLDGSKKLVELPSTMSVGDACALSYSETLIIPTENTESIPNLLIKITDEGIPPENEDDACDYSKWRDVYKTELFEWKNNEVRKVK